MMVNGRPYSNENGYIDAGLITNHPQEEIDAVMGWISESISPCKTPLYNHTSYGIKHLLERDTKIYITNNEFKDAMLMSGYNPVNPCHSSVRLSTACSDALPRTAEYYAA